MTETVGLLTSVKLQREEFVEFVHALQIPDTKIAENPEYGDIQLVRGKQNIWVALHNEELSFYEQEQMNLVRQKLGNDPQTSIDLSIFDIEPTSQELAVEFIARFAGRWPCVVDNNQAGDDFKVYSLQEVFEIQKRGEKIWH